MNTQQFFQKITVLLLPLVLFCSCNSLFEYLEECDYTLRFRYDYNMENKDWFAEQVDRVQVFVFDREGKFVRSFSEKGDNLKKTGYKMTIPHLLKGNKMVVWAGETATFYTMPTLKTGDPIEMLMLSYHPENNISTARLDPLWHCGPTIMSFEEENGTTQTVSLIRTTNDVKVSLRIKNEGTVDPERFDIRITGNNNIYDYTHALGTCNEVAYMPSPATGNRTTAYICCMRFIKGNDLFLSVKEKSSGRPISIGGQTEINLINYFLMSKPSEMNEQEYLDRRYIWEILIDYDTRSYVALSITVNGWTRWFQSPEL